MEKLSYGFEISYEDAFDLAIKTITYSLPYFIVGYLSIYFSFNFIKNFALTLIISTLSALLMGIGSLIVLYNKIIPEIIERANAEQNYQIRKCLKEELKK